ncbi:MAG: AAA family ATPase [Idiomarinaceae bacterium]|uniref:AAA family ATPase n=1 Tax=Idiomarina sp. 28-8 TaxID=1260624 RepID=UPI0002E40F02|nr:AAA family ATPase [Idiomarina sp. 28-8]NWO04029.1 AAA family ATPase [Idiomarinaceae bacterium]
MSAYSGLLQIRKVRNRGKIGGIIFSANTLEKKPTRYVVKADWKIAPTPSIFKEGHIWSVSGNVETQTIKWKDGTSANENVLVPNELRFAKASNENLKRLLSESKEFAGVSKIKAEKLVSFFGDELYQIAANNEIERLLPMLGRDVATRLINGLKGYQDLNTLKLLDELGVPHQIGESVLRIWGAEAYEKIQANPYLLSIFMANLKMVDEYAINRLGFSLDSPQRLIAYVKEVLFSAFNAGNTCLPTSEAKYRVKRLLGSLSSEALQLAQESGEIIVDGNITQVRSMDIIESGVAEIIANLAQANLNKGQEKQISAKIDTFEIGAGFNLTQEQREAVTQCCTNRLAVLTGGAGCGKTTVIEAICFVLGSLHQTKQIFLMALAGKAAQRITEATGREAITVASFMYNVDAEDIDDDAVFIVDEASMIDVLSLFKILKRIPCRGRLILTGDEEQLPPVGIGLSLHALVKQAIPKANLTTVKRQAESSGIPSVALKIRGFQKDETDLEFKPFLGIADGVNFIECNSTDIERKCIEVYEALGGDGSNNDVLILSPTKNLNGGVINLNCGIYDKFSQGEVVNFDHEDFGNVNCHISGRALRVGELVMYTKNDYQRDIRNGSVGKVLAFNRDSVTVDFEGNATDLSIIELSNLEHAYALTVHKAQGSQFERVIVVIKESRNLDRHLIYTALTRAKKQVVFVGQRQSMYSALTASNAHKRHTNLPKFLSVQLS